MSYLESLFNFKNKNIIICGAAGHICSEIAISYSKLHTNLFLIDKSLTKLEKLYHKIKDSNKDTKIKIFEADTTDLSIMEDVNIEITKNSKIDILINGSGINNSSNFLDINLEDWNNVVQSQLNSVFIACKVFGRSMVKNKNGSIINISSTSAGPPLSRAFAYSSAKAAITNLTKNIARDWANSGVRVNSLRPGFFPTEWNKKNFLDEKRIKNIFNHTPMKRFGDPKELMTAILYLSSDASTFVTGSEVTIDGGFSCMTI